MSRLVHRPPWRECLSIIRAESEKAGVDADAVVMCQSIDRKVTAARRSAVRRILKEIGCTQAGLSQVWGIGVMAIRAALAEVGEKRSYKAAPQSPKPKVRETYDDMTRRRLAWKYGDARASQIIAGEDPNTNADIARWRAIGSRRAA